MSFKEVTGRYDGPAIENDVLEFWREHDVFEESLRMSEGRPLFTFNEGPPTANGKPGIHHVLARSFKDIYPRYKTMQGFHVPRKAGWDTHGLPVEHEVEKKLKREGLIESYDKAEIEEKVGIAEFTNRRTAEAVDQVKTRINCITGGHPTGGMMPMVFDTDRVEGAIVPATVTGTRGHQLVAA